MIHLRPSSCLTAFVCLLCILYWLTPQTTRSASFDTSKWAEKLQQAQKEFPYLHLDSLSSAHLSNSYGDDGSPSEQEIQAKVFPDVEAGSDQPSSSPAMGSSNIHIPHSIWQTSNESFQESNLDSIETWKQLRDFKYTWLSDSNTSLTIKEQFASRPAVMELWNTIINIREQNNTYAVQQVHANFFKYLNLYAQGGIYSSVASSCLAYPDRWIPPQFASHEINAIIGVEHIVTQPDVKPSTKNSPIPVSNKVQFVSWVLASKPHHPIFEKAVERAGANLKPLLSSEQLLTLSEAGVSSITGSKMLSNVIMEVLRQSTVDGEEVSAATFTNMTEPMMIKDVLVLPPGAFASTPDQTATANALVQLRPPHSTPAKASKPGPQGKDGSQTKPAPGATSPRIVTPPAIVSAGPPTPPPHPDSSNSETTDTSNVEADADAEIAEFYGIIKPRGRKRTPVIWTA